jgi:hypothetical protein
MKALVFLLLVLPLPLLSAAEKSGRAVDPAATARIDKTKATKSKWVFEFLPKAFQRNPLLEMTVFTEMTNDGKKVTPATREHPVYYEVVAPGYRQEGGAMAYHPPPPSELLDALEKSLAAAGYLRATSGPSPALLLVEHWGAHTRVDDMFAESDPDLAVKNIIARARLIGGESFARQLLEAYNYDILAPSELATGAFSKLGQLRDSSPTMRFLFEQAQEDVYFVVASAYDYAATARNEKSLLWRTTMTANTQGVSMKQTFPPLIATATPYFGHETTQALAISARGIPEGKVELGELRVIGEAEDLPPPKTDDDPPKKGPPAKP